MHNAELDKQLSTIGTRECRQWSQRIFHRHLPISLYLKRTYVRTARQHGYKAANTSLRLIDKDLRWADGSSCVFDDDKIKHLALIYSGDARNLFDRVYRRSKDVRTAAFSVCTYVRDFGLETHFDKDWTRLNEDQIQSQCLRAFDERWWRRKLRSHSIRTVEATLRRLGFVRKQSGVYASNYALNKVKAQRKRNDAWIDAMLAIADDGTQINLRDAVDASLANPKVRRADLMARLRGYEELAYESGYAALFLTMTCPSAYHAVLGASGRQNPKFEGYTPKEGMQYLNSVWQRVRADYGKAKLQVAGFRICEPHHDGTPHFHFLLYIPKPQVAAFCEIFRKHNLKQNGDELGADEYRCDIQELDLDNGSPTGYVAKYIAKNVDGEDVGEDLEAELEATNTAERVIAWASLWGIRQFQQIGNTPATVYREFRRLPTPLTGRNAETAEKARQAADGADYAGFIKATGGMFVRRQCLVFRAFHIVKDKLTSFGEEMKRLLGILSVEHSAVIQTRFQEWTLSPAGVAVRQEAAQPPPLEYWQ